MGERLGVYLDAWVQVCEQAGPSLPVVCTIQSFD